MTSLGLALFTIMWNCIGWDNATTYAGEVKRPVRSYLTAMLLAFTAVYFFYLSFTYLVLHTGISGPEFAEKGIPYLGTLVGGNSLGGMLSMGGMASMLGIFCAVMLSVSQGSRSDGKRQSAAQIIYPPASEISYALYIHHRLCLYREYTRAAATGGFIYHGYLSVYCRHRTGICGPDQPA